MLWLFVIACIAGEYFYQHESVKGQIVVWGTFVSIVVGFLVYIRVKNK
jgi:high-affinity Fe2+/Pb2+ permease